MKKNCGFLKCICAVMALCLGGVVSFAQEKGLPYYNEHGNEILPDAQAAFRNGDYARAVNLCEWQFIVVGNHKADELKEKAKRCADLVKEINRLKASGQMTAALEKARSLSELNSYDKTERELTRAIEDEKYAEKGYMEITSIDFANADSGDNLLTDYGGTLFKEEMRYLTYKINYNGLSSEKRDIVLSVKIFGPNGSLLQGSDSPSGFTWKGNLTAFPGKGQVIVCRWGNATKGTFSAGQHRVEIWCNGKRQYTANFTIKEKETALSKGGWRTKIKKPLDNPTQSYGGGEAYKGQTSSGYRNGWGAYMWNSSCYWGRWSNGSRNGTGIYLVTDDTSELRNCHGCIYFVGSFSNGLKSGQGTCYDKYGNLIYYGDFSDDAPTGKYPASTGYSSYKFEYIELSGGDFYLGETKDGKFEGLGIYVWANGDAWYGTFEDGVRKGRGAYFKYSYTDDILVGKWNNNTYSE